MKEIKRMLFVLLAGGLCIGLSSVALAQDHGQAGHAPEQASSHEQQGHEQVQAAHEPSHAAAANDHAVEETHPAPAHGEADPHGAEAAHGEGHGGGHVAPMITADKLWDLLWRALNFAVLLFLLVNLQANPLSAFLVVGDKK